MSNVTISHTVDKAAKKDGMTLGELAVFLQEADRAGIELSTPVKVTTGFRSQIHKLEVSG